MYVSMYVYTSVYRLLPVFNLNREYQVNFGLKTLETAIWTLYF